MATEVVYARVPEGLKEAVGTYASERGLTQAGAVAELLERGLESAASGGSIIELQDRVRNLREELAEANRQLAGLQQLATRIQKVVGKCPECRNAVTGYDVFALGQCSNCRKNLASLLIEPAGAKGLDKTELLLLIGALGLVLTVAYAQSQQSA